MTGTLANHKVIVTGGASGIGRATVEHLASHGAAVVIADVNDAAVAELCGSLKKEGYRVSGHHLDVTSRDDWERLVAATVSTFGGVNGLVNNAGITKDRSLLKMTDSEWETVLDVNLRGLWLGCQYVIPHMKEAGGGSIVNLSSESRDGAFGQANYASAKAGVVGLTKTVAVEHSRHGIRCNAIAPGTIETSMLADVPAEVKESWLPRIPLARLGKPQEVARAIAFLISEDSSYITGQVIGVDGGSTL